MSTIRELTPEEFKKLQSLEMDMLVEFDRVCRNNNIQYVITGGTMIGAVRHKGIIPWDDDIDVAMLREEYEKFRKVASQLNPSICYFQDHYNDPDYLWEYSKLRRTGTTYIRAGQEHMKGKTGVFLDIFPMDDVPNGLILQLLFDFKCFFLRKVLYARVGKVNEKGIWKLWYTLLANISVDWVYSKIEKIADKSRNASLNGVRVLLWPAWGKMAQNPKNPFKERFCMNKKWFSERAEYEFEGHMVYGTKDFDGLLTYMYNDYMEIPPEDQRQQHSPVSSFSFGDEEELNS